MTWSSLSRLTLLLLLVGCAGSSSRGEELSRPPSGAAGAAGASASSTSGSTSTPSVATAKSDTAPTPTVSPNDLFSRLKPDLVRCYEAGKKSTPSMTDGKIVLAAGVDPAQRTACVIPMDTSGITREVEDCMSSRVAKEPFDAKATVTLPITLKGGALSLEEGGGAKPSTISLDSIETYRMPDAFEALDAIESDLGGCVRGIDKSLGVRSILVGARVRTDGKNQCALTTSPSPSLPPKIAECLSGVVRSTAFPPPKGGPGLVLIPIQLLK